MDIKSARTWIITAGIVMFLAFGYKSYETNQDIPDGIKGVLVLIFGAGLGAEPLANMANKVLNKDKEGDSNK